MPPPQPDLCDALLPLLAHAPDGMARFDAAQCLLWANPAFAKALSSTVEELLGKPLADLDARLRPLLTEGMGSPGPLSQCLQAAAAGRPITLRFVNGTEQLLRGLTEPQGTFNVYLSDLAPMQAQERRRSEFLSVAAHELRNPVASLFGFAQLLRSRKLKPEGFAEVTEILCRQADSLSHLVEELLDLARVDAKRGQDFKREAVSLSALIQEARESLPSGLHPQRIHVRIAASAELLWVDRSKTLRVLINVLSNALKYSPSSTPVEIDARRIKGSSEMADIVVLDHGIGMSNEQQARIFERFYRADPSGPIPGTGLGMSLVQEIVTLLGGSVSVKSALGQGCRVNLRLPLVATPTKDQMKIKGFQQDRPASPARARENPWPLGEKQGD
ncbi:ATP-binding protein [Ideonella sp.]|jgi:signal transduction histidine kinase|uniref:sensor histidine kinase n=1 Tax=Ideonella sp. TaxID=1929293 RepID=UPI0037BF868B